MMEAKPANLGEENAVCARCGGFDVLEIAGQFLCADCVTLAGCGCSGPGNDE